MILILEGPDGSGKSTLGKQLAADLGVEYVYPGKPENVYQCQEIVNHVDSLREDSRLYIIDRTPWISDLIYATAFDRPTLMKVKDIVEYQAKPGQFPIFCLPTCLSKSDISQEVKPHKSKWHMQKVMANHERIINLYDRIFRTNFPNSPRYNFRKEGSYEEIKQYAKKLKD